MKIYARHSAFHLVSSEFLHSIVLLGCQLSILAKIRIAQHGSMKNANIIKSFMSFLFDLSISERYLRSSLPAMIPGELCIRTTTVLLMPLGSLSDSKSASLSRLPFLLSPRL